MTVSRQEFMGVESYALHYRGKFVGYCMEKPSRRKVRRIKREIRGSFFSRLIRWVKR